MQLLKVLGAHNSNRSLTTHKHSSQPSLPPHRLSMRFVQTDATDGTSVSLEGEADSWLGAMALSLVSITLFAADQQLVHFIVGKVHACSSSIAGRLSMQFQTLLHGGGRGGEGRGGEED